MLDPKAHAQFDAARESCLKALKRGKAQNGDSLKAPTKSTIKPVVFVDAPSSSTPSRHNLEMVARFSLVPTITVADAKNEIVESFSSYLEK